MLSYSMIQWLKRNGFRLFQDKDSNSALCRKKYNSQFCLTIFKDGSFTISRKKDIFVTYSIKGLPQRITTMNDILILDRYMRSGLLFGRTPYKR